MMLGLSHLTFQDGWQSHHCTKQLQTVQYKVTANTRPIVWKMVTDEESWDVTFPLPALIYRTSVAALVMENGTQVEINENFVFWLVVIYQLVFALAVSCTGRIKVCSRKFCTGGSKVYKGVFCSGGFAQHFWLGAWQLRGNRNLTRCPLSLHLTKG